MQRDAPMTRLVVAEGAILERIVATTPLLAYGGLSREAFVKFEAAQARTPGSTVIDADSP